MTLLLVFSLMHVFDSCHTVPLIQLSEIQYAV